MGVAKPVSVDSFGDASTMAERRQPTPHIAGRERSPDAVQKTVPGRVVAATGANVEQRCRIAKAARSTPTTRQAPCSPPRRFRRLESTADFPAKTLPNPVTTAPSW
jgi:hypothetical protein